MQPRTRRSDARSARRARSRRGISRRRPARPATRSSIAAYAALAAQTDALFATVTAAACRRPVRVTFTAEREPYSCDRELIEAVRRERTLEVPTAAHDHDRRHPILGCERGGAYDRFRAVHDIVGHVGLRRRFRSGRRVPHLARRRIGSTGAWRVGRWRRSSTPSTACSGRPARRPSTRHSCSNPISSVERAPAGRVARLEDVRRPTVYIG